jgi:hypothetical protein
MLTGLKDQTLKIESSTTAVTELSASIQTVAGNAAQATQVAEQSSTAVTSAVQRMESIRAAVADAADKMRELGESSKRIGNIVEVIRQISEQTSMLALNASIEAAHAGEQGRGFAVVADEVSSLARRVGQSAKDIEALIQTVKEQTQAAITSMEVGARSRRRRRARDDDITSLAASRVGARHAVPERAVFSTIARAAPCLIAGEMLTGSESGRPGGAPPRARVRARRVDRRLQPRRQRRRHGRAPDTHAPDRRKIGDAARPACGQTQTREEDPRSPPTAGRSERGGRRLTEAR